MRESRTVQTFRAFLESINKLMTRRDAPSRQRRESLEGKAAQVGLKLEDSESKGRPEQEDLSRKRPVR